MPFEDIDKNANILRLIVDNSRQSSNFLTTALIRAIGEIMDEEGCRDADEAVNFLDGIEIMERSKYRLQNIDMAYLIILVVRGYKFRPERNKIYFCEENAIIPLFEKLENIKPKMSPSYEIKSKILQALLETLDKDDDYILRILIRTLPEFLEKTEGVRYTGRFLSISEWIDIKEKNPNSKWVEQEDSGMLKLKDISILPWLFANLIILQIRGYHLQEIPSVAGNSYIFVKKRHPTR